MASDRNVAYELAQWARLAATHGRDSWEGRPESANRAHAELRAIEDGLKAADAGAVREALAPLLAHDDPYVRVAAASWMLSFDPDIAVPVLEQLDREFGGGWQITAHYNLGAFRDGTYPGGA